MTTRIERRVDVLARRLRARTKHDGTPLPGYEQNVAAIRAELGMLNEQAAQSEDGDE